jgi:alpha-tubulin suppressor-like RCC1 family protein/microcystin-dependent protein
MSTDIKISELNEISVNKTINQLIVNDRANSSDPGITRKISISNLLPTYNAADSSRRAIVGNEQLISTQQSPGSEAVNTNVIRDSAITESKIASQSVTGSKIANSTITNTNIADGTLLGSKISTTTSITVNSLNATTLQGSTLNVTGNTTFNTKQYTWPSSYTGDRYLRVDGAGNLSWSQPIQGSGTSLVFADAIPIGAIMPWASASTPSNYLLCNGGTFNGTQYPGLSSILGETYGPKVGDLYKLPDLRGKIAVGSGTNVRDVSGNTATFTLGTSGGEYVHTLTIAEIPPHKHDLTIRTTGSQGDSTVPWGLNNSGTTGNADSSITMGLTGGGESHTNTQPYLVTNYIIKALPDPKVNFNLIVGPGLSANTATGNIDLSGGTLQVRVDNTSIGFDGLNRLTLVNQPVPQIVRQFPENSNNRRFVGDGFAFVDYEGNARVIGENSAYNRFGTLNVYAPGAIVPLPNNVKVSKLFTTDDKTFILTTAGNVYAMGRNDYGQLGVGGTTSTISYPTQCNLSNITKMILSYDDRNLSTMALDSNGRLYSFGHNGFGQLGNGTTTNTGIGNPGLVLGSVIPVVDVVAAGGYNLSTVPETYCALLANSQVRMVGYGGYGQMGNNTTTSTNTTWLSVVNPLATTQPLSGIVAVYAGGYDASTAFYALSAGNNLSLSGGRLYGWGRGEWGNFGNNSVTETNSIPVLVTTNVLSAWVGGGNGQPPFLIVKRREANGSTRIYGCGENSSGQLGTGVTTNARQLSAITSLDGIDIEQIYISGVNSPEPHVFAKEKNTNRIFATGYNAQGQLGLGDYVQRNSFTPVNFNITSSIVDIYCNFTDAIGGTTTILTADGQTYITGKCRWGAGTITDTNRVFFARNTQLLC